MHQSESRFTSLLANRHRGLAFFILLYLSVSFTTRCVLVAAAATEVDWDSSLLRAYCWGALFDLGAAAWVCVLLATVLGFVPEHAFERAWIQRIAHAAFVFALGVMIFNAIAELFFWLEFETRFNFIAVDYLVYTTEVLANIRESYPLTPIFTGVFGATALTYWALCRLRVPQTWLANAAAPRRARIQWSAAWIIGCAGFGTFLDSSDLPRFDNAYNRALAMNGTWSLFAAFRINELDYREFYATRDLSECYASLHSELCEDGSLLLNSVAHDTLRYVPSYTPPTTPNIIQITVESLSANFLGIFNPELDLTPNLDEIAQRSLLFDEFYATGTRTVRGMEALSMSVPPTPGRSIVKRPRNANMFTLGSVLRSRGYDTAFIYGGFGYFDNMNAFFSANGYRIVDRASASQADVTFANAWGACDEDLFDWTLREADRSYSSGVPFHHFVMTTSNHRPYTFPEGRIDLPSGTAGRAGAVKYTDFAIGRFLDAASRRPWFNDTIFVIVADHCAASAGRTELPLANYHIPLMIYAPGGHIPPGRNSTRMSQIDYAPTLLGLLGWDYMSRFFGHDVLRVLPGEAHALVGTYQRLGHWEGTELTVLAPRRGIHGYVVDARSLDCTSKEASDDVILNTIAFYQTASDMYGRDAYRALSTAEHDSLLQGFRAQGRAAR